MREHMEIVWAAGLFDGEGSVRCRGRYRILTLSQVDRQTMDRFIAAVGVGKANGPEIKGPERRPIWLWWACAQNAVTVANKLLPWVSERNRARLEELVATYEADKRGTCEWCGTTYKRHHRDRRFCSNSCRAKARRARVNTAA